MREMLKLSYLRGHPRVVVQPYVRERSRLQSEEAWIVACAHLNDLLTGADPDDGE